MMDNELPAVLVTEVVAAAQGERLDQLLAGRGRVQILEPQQPLPAAQLADVQAAFLSADLMGSSNKQQPNARLAGFGAAVDGCSGLRWLHACSAGTDRQLLQDAMRRGVTVTSSAGVNAATVAQCAIAGMLALLRGVPRWVRAQDAKRWELRAGATVPRDLSGQHAIVVGLGAIGGEVARLCRALGLRVTGVRRQAQPHPDCDAVGTLADLPALAASADWVFLCCALTEETRGLVNAKLLAGLSARAHLINVSRGEVVVEADLFDAVQRGALAGVYADVFEYEPLPAESSWWTLPNTLLSPHVGGRSDGSARRMQEMFIENLERWLDGRELRNVARLP